MSAAAQSRDEMLTNMAASSICIAGAVIAFNPLDCLRVRWQVAASAQGLGQANAGLVGYARAIVAKEGLAKGLWFPGVGSNALGAATGRGIGMGCYPAVRAKSSLTTAPPPSQCSTHTDTVSCPPASPG